MQAVLGEVVCRKRQASPLGRGIYTYTTKPLNAGCRCKVGREALQGTVDEASTRDGPKAAGTLCRTMRRCETVCG